MQRQFGEAVDKRFTFGDRIGNFTISGPQSQGLAIIIGSADQMIDRQRGGKILKNRVQLIINFLIASAIQAILHYLHRFDQIRHVGLVARTPLFTAKS